MDRDLNRRRFLKLLGISPLALQLGAVDLSGLVDVAEAGDRPNARTRPRKVRPIPRAKGRVKAENKRRGTSRWKSKTLRKSRGPRGVTGCSTGCKAAAACRSYNARREGESECWLSSREAGLAPVWQDTAIRGYPGAASVNAGDTLDLFVGTTAPSYNIEVYRMGYYGGGGARLMQRITNLPGQPQAVPAAAPDTRLVECNWSLSHTLITSPNWVSGIYLAKLIASTGAVGYTLFVVRNDGRPADILYVLPVTTYHAYNNWGGYSLYDFNSEDGNPAHKVSLDRPYAGWAGAGGFFDGDYSFIRWLEAKGYDVTYATSVDLHTNPGIMLDRKVFLSPWHDEYYTAEMRAAVTGFRDAGKHVAYFSANNIYWQIRLEPSSAGRPNRVVVGYKDYAPDPILSTDPSRATVLWRDAPVNRPESVLLGSMYGSHFVYGTTFPWVAANATHWVYDGTGIKSGDSIGGLIGYEYDKLWRDQPLPPGVTTLSASPVVDLEGVRDTQESSIYQHSSGAFVFNAATIYWAWKLDDNEFQQHGADDRVSRMTQNVLATMINGAPPRPVASPALAEPIFDDVLANGWENWSWNSQTNLAVASPVFRGSLALSFNMTAAWGALYLRRSTPVDTSPYSHLTFAARATRTGQSLSVWLVDAAGARVGRAVALANYGGDAPADAWRVYNIPLDDDNLATAGRAISGVIIQDYTGGSQPAVYIDDLGFGVAGPQTPKPDFSVTPAEPFLNVARGASGVYHLVVRGTGGFESPVSVDVAGLPSDATATVTPSRAVPGAEGTTFDVTVTLGSAVVPGTRALTFQATGGGLTRTATADLVVPAPTFALTSPVTSATIAKGAEGTFDITATALNGFTGAVALSLAGLPSGVTRGFSPVNVTPSAEGVSSTLRISVAATAAGGTYPVTVSAVGGGVTQTLALSIIVPTTPGFEFSVSPATVSVSRFGTATTTARLTAIDGFKSSVKITASGLPSGVTVTTSPTSRVPTASGTTMTVRFIAGFTAKRGTRTVTLTARGNGVTRIATVTLTVR